MDLFESTATHELNSHSMSGYPRVSSDMLCVLTRMRLRHWWLLLPSYFRFRRIRQRSEGTSGLIRFAFAVEFPRTYYIVSLWRNEKAILFWDLPEHVETVRWAFRHTDEIWSAEWRLSALSPRTRWNGQDVRPEDLAFLGSSIPRGPVPKGG